MLQPGRQIHKRRLVCSRVMSYAGGYLAVKDTRAGQGPISVCLGDKKPVLTRGDLTSRSHRFDLEYGI